MNTLSRICTVFMLAGAASLFAADTAATTDTKTPSADKSGPRTPGRGPRGGHHGPGPGGNFTIMVCPNCHHKLIVLSPGGRGGHGGRDGRFDGRGDRDGRGGRRFRGGEGKGPGRGQRNGEGKGQSQRPAHTEEQTAK